MADHNTVKVICREFKREYGLKAEARTLIGIVNEETTRYVVLSKNLESGVYTRHEEGLGKVVSSFVRHGCQLEMEGWEAVSNVNNISCQMDSRTDIASFEKRMALHLRADDEEMCGFVGEVMKMVKISPRKKEAEKAPVAAVAIYTEHELLGSW